MDSRKRISKRRKYEAKQVEWSGAVCLPGRWSAQASSGSGAKLVISFILAAGNFSNMFTTYSHMLCVVLASGLETRNQLQKRQEKNEFYF